ncbi:MAG: hypothetical protein KBD05_02265 [Candidatus Pacebacteria bacterium]|nr:hypothetical protein [Candidatus Paceibacterota bacterium]
MPRLLKTIFYALVTLFAVVGLAFTAVYVAMQFGLLNVRGSILERNAFFTSGQEIPAEPCTTDGVSSCDWKETPEWVVVAGGLTKDAELINQVSKETGVSARLMAAVVIPEQIRFFTSEREVFKRYFEPLKILGSLTQFSLGVSGIKQETAEEIERHAADPTSPFYPGPGLAELIAYAPGVDQKAELFNRLTDDTNHYYSYLYTALYLKEVEVQWERAGFSLDNRPEILVTLFNIGFANSRPGPTPEVGGAPIEVGGNVYSFGDLGGRFFRSDELRDLFPN